MEGGKNRAAVFLVVTTRAYTHPHAHAQAHIYTHATHEHTHILTRKPLRRQKCSSAGVARWSSRCRVKGVPVLCCYIYGRILLLFGSKRPCARHRCGGGSLRRCVRRVAVAAANGGQVFGLFYCFFFQPPCRRAEPVSMYAQSPCRGRAFSRCLCGRCARSSVRALRSSQCPRSCRLRLSDRPTCPRPPCWPPVGMAKPCWPVTRWPWPCKSTRTVPCSECRPGPAVTWPWDSWTRLRPIPWTCYYSGWTTRPAPDTYWWVFCPVL